MEMNESGNLRDLFRIRCAFAATQVRKTPADCRHPAMDEATGLARQSERSVLQSRGRIWSHRDAPLDYNMQEVFIDMLLRHLLYSGDRTLLKEVYPVIAAHLEWENDKPTVLALREIAAGLVGPEILLEADPTPAELFAQEQANELLAGPPINMNDDSDLI